MARLVLVLAALTAGYTAARLGVPWWLVLLAAVFVAADAYAARLLLARPRRIPPTVDGYPIGHRRTRRTR